MPTHVQDLAPMGVVTCVVQPDEKIPATWHMNGIAHRLVMAKSIPTGAWYAVYIRPKQFHMNDSDMQAIHASNGRIANPTKEIRNA